MQHALSGCAGPRDGSSAACRRRSRTTRRHALLTHSLIHPHTHAHPPSHPPQQLQVHGAGFASNRQAAASHRLVDQVWVDQVWVDQAWVDQAWVVEIVDRITNTGETTRHNDSRQ